MKQGTRLSVTVIFPIISLYFFTTLIISAISGRSALAFSSPQLCRGSSLTLKPGITSDTLNSFEIDSHRRAFQSNMSKPKISRHYDSKLMSTAPLSGITAFAGVIIGGVIGGALHAISGEFTSSSFYHSWSRLVSSLWYPFPHSKYVIQLSCSQHSIFGFVCALKFTSLQSNGGSV